MRRTGWSSSMDKRSLGVQIYEQLREDIVYLRYEPGQMIYENEIAERLQVSRTPVREAFRLLASEQLIEVQPQRGTRVSLISVSKVAETWFIRERLECGAFAEAAYRWNEQIASEYEAQLAQILKQQETAAHAKDIETLLRTDEEFHRLIMSISGNRTLLGIIDQLRAHINRTRLLSLKDNRHLLRIVAEHIDLLNDIKRNKPKEVEDGLLDHFSNLEDEIDKLREKHPTYFTD